MGIDLPTQLSANAVSIGPLAIGVPLVLAGFVPIAGWLLYLYRKRAKSPPRTIGSLLLFKSLQGMPAAPRKARLPWRLLLELLLFLALLSALARTRFETEPRKVALVIDNSLSMGARLGTDVLAGTRLKEARSRALRWLVNHGNDLVTVFRACPTLERVTAPTAGEAHPALDPAGDIQRVSLCGGDDRLDSSLSTLAAEGEFEHIVVFTDRTTTSGTTPPGIELDSLESPAAGTLQNIALSKLELNPAGEGATLDVTVSNFSRNLVRAAIEIDSLAERSPKLAWEPNERRTVTIPADGSESVSFRLARTDFGAWRVRANIQTEQGAARLDPLEEDDIAWVTRSGSATAIRVVSPLAPAALKLDGIGGEQFEYVSADEAGREPLPALIVLHRTLPTTLPRVPALIIAPPPGEFAAGEIVKAPEITAWEEQASPLRYVTLPALSIPEMVTLTALPWASPLVRTTKGPAALWGTDRGVRRAVFAFELLPFQGRASPGSSILLLNTIAWLKEGAANAAPLAAGGARPMLLESINGIKEQGLFALASKPGDEPTLTARFVPLPEESRLAQRPLAIVAQQGNSKERPSSSSDLIPWLAAAVLLMLACDLALLIVMRGRLAPAGGGLRW